MTKDNTWREVTLTLPPRMAYTHVFEDTKPNHYDINNLSVATLYAGVRVLPSPHEYELMVPSNGRNILARKEGSSQIEIYNDSDVTARIILTTFNEPFNPAVLANSASGTSGGGGGGATDGNVIVKGFSSALPAGNNNLGKVVVTEMPAVSFMLQTLPPGTNHIGAVTVAKLPPLAEGTSHIGSVNVEGGVSISAMPPVQVTNDPVRASHFYFEAMIGTGNYICNVGDVIKFSYLVNEGDTDLFLNFDDNTLNPNLLSGKNMTIRLKPGEQLSEFTRKANKITFVRQSGNGMVRLLGV